VSETSSELAQAIEWFARLNGAPAGAPRPAGLDDWLGASDANRAAFEKIQAQWSRLGSIGHDPRIVAMQARTARGRGARRAPVAPWRAALAACLVGLVAAGGLYASGMLPGPQRGVALRTSVGEVSVRRLPDGSTVTLDTDSALRFHATAKGRFVELKKGRARFQVAKDKAHPFSVLAAGNRVTAVGTDFDVYLRPGAVQVNLMEGKLRVTGDDAHAMAVPVDMAAGDRLTAGEGPWRLVHSDTPIKANWTNHRLIFNDSTLGDMAQELNRYSSRRIVIRDPKVAQLRMSAVINTSDNASFLAAINELALARVEARGDTVKIVAR
jgi:transmembrane sensor